MVEDLLFIKKKGFFMHTIKIIADSTCDLSEELLEQYDIGIIPLCIVMGEKSYYDKTEITPEEIFEWADKNHPTPKTAAVTFEKASEILKSAADAGNDILFFGISEKMSTTCNVIRMINETADNLDAACQIRVIDSMNLSTGIGLQVLYAARLAREGKHIDEIVRLVEERRKDVRASFVVDTLTYLARGGRCSSVTALLANTLKLKPEIIVTDGAMTVAKKYRGSLQSVLLKYAKDLEPALLTADKNCVFITHSGCSEAIVESVKAYLQSLNHFAAIYVTRAGGVISSHCGPGTLGILFYQEER